MRRPDVPVAAALAVLLPFAVGVGSTRTAADTPPSRLVSGTVVSVVDETPAEGMQARRLALVTADAVLPLSSGAGLTPGDRVTARVVTGGSRGRPQIVSRSRAGAAPTAPVLDRAVYVAFVSPAGYAIAANQNTLAAVRTTLQRASDYWSDQTGGRIHFALAGSLPAYVSAFSCDDTVGMWNEALERFRAAGQEAFGPGRHLLVVAPTGLSETDTCSYGRGTLGSLDSAAGNAVFVTDRAQSLYAHELGHNLGLDHANSLRCPGLDNVWDPAGLFPGCTATEYDDLLDVMGYSGEQFGEGSLNIAHQDDLGLQPGAIATVPPGSSQTIEIAPLSDAGSRVRGIRVQDADGGWYYVEYRADAGRDHIAVINPFAPSLGVLLTRDDPESYERHGTYQLDATPTGRFASDYDRALPAGRTVHSASGMLAFRVLSVGATGATVAVSNGAAIPAPPEPATLAISAPARVRARAAARFTATVRDTAGAGVAGVEALLQAYHRERWTTVRHLRTTAAGAASTSYAVARTTRFRFATPAGLLSAVRTVRVR